MGAGPSRTSGKNSGWPVSKPVLYTVGNYGQFPMYQELSEHFAIAYLNDQAFAIAKQHDFDAIQLTTFINNPERIEFVKANAIWQAQKIMNAISSEDLVLDEEQEFLHGKGLGSWLPTFYYEQSVAAMLRIFACALCTEENGASGVLVHEDVLPEGRALAMWGREEKIPVLHLPHANHFGRPGSGDIHNEVTAPTLGVFGEYMKGWYMANGAKEEQITVVGNPNWDQYYLGELHPDKTLSRKAFGLSEDDLIVCYASTWPQATSVWDQGLPDIKKRARMVMEASVELGAKLIVKMHPGEAPDMEKWYQEQMREAGAHGAITRRHTKYALKGSDVVLTQGPSNLAVEAMIMGTPVVELLQDGACYPPEYGIPSTRGYNLLKCIEEAREKGPSEDFVRDMNYDNDGLATERAVEWVLRNVEH